MLDEMQAYLMFTRDPAFFAPERAGLTQTRLVELQTRFLAGMPAGQIGCITCSPAIRALLRPHSRRPSLPRRTHIVTISIVKVDRDSVNKPCLITIS